MLIRLRTWYTCIKSQRNKWRFYIGDSTCACGRAEDNHGTHVGHGPNSVSHQVVAALLRQIDFCNIVNRKLFANHYLKVPMFSVAHFSLRPIKKYFDEAKFSLTPRGGMSESL